MKKTNQNKKDLSKMKTLILEDCIFKKNKIIGALTSCGIKKDNIVSFTNQKDGIDAIYCGIKKDTSFDLIITDMHYPLDSMKQADRDAGFKLIKRLEKEEINIPIIICSTIRYHDPKILGCVWYDNRRDLYLDFKEIFDAISLKI